MLEQSVWVLGNLAGEGAATRDLVLNAGALLPLVNNLKKTSWDRLSLLRILTWTLSNLCDGQPRPVFDITIILPYLAKVCSHLAIHPCKRLANGSVRVDADQYGH